MAASCLLRIFNCIFVVTGIVLIVIGSLVEVHAREYFNFINDPYISTATLFIILGAVILVIALIGCIGATKQHRCLLCFFAVSLMVIFLLEVIAAILVYIHIDGMGNLVKQGLRNSFDKANTTDENAIKTWEEIQNSFECCGLEGPQDFDNSTEIPYRTCCKKLDIEINCVHSLAYTDGCYAKFLDFLNSNIKIIGGSAIAIAAIQVLCVALACYLAGKYKMSIT